MAELIRARGVIKAIYLVMSIVKIEFRNATITKGSQHSKSKTNTQANNMTDFLSCFVRSVFTLLDFRSEFDDDWPATVVGFVSMPNTYPQQN